MLPAAQATLMVGTEQFGVMFTVLSLTVNLVIVLLLFSKSGAILQKLGSDATDAINKIFSLLIAAIGVMLVRSGLIDMMLIK